VVDVVVVDVECCVSYSGVADFGGVWVSGEVVVPIVAAGSVIPDAWVGDTRVRGGWQHGHLQSVTRFVGDKVVVVDHVVMLVTENSDAPLIVVCHVIFGETVISGVQKFNAEEIS